MQWLDILWQHNSNDKTKLFFFICVLLLSSALGCLNKRKRLQDEAKQHQQQEEQRQVMENFQSTGRIYDLYQHNRNMEQRYQTHQPKSNSPNYIKQLNFRKTKNGFILSKR